MRRWTDGELITVNQDCNGLDGSTRLGSERCCMTATAKGLYAPVASISVIIWLRVQSGSLRRSVDSLNTSWKKSWNVLGVSRDR